MKARRAAKKGTTEEDAQKELEEKLLKEQAEDSEADKRNALDMEQGGLALLQEAILSEVERKHASEQEVRFVPAYLKVDFGVSLLSNVVATKHNLTPGFSNQQFRALFLKEKFFILLIYTNLCIQYSRFIFVYSRKLLRKGFVLEDNNRSRLLTENPY